MKLIIVLLFLTLAVSTSYGKKKNKTYFNLMYFHNEKCSNLKVQKEIYIKKSMKFG